MLIINIWFCLRSRYGNDYGINEQSHFNSIGFARRLGVWTTSVQEHMAYTHVSADTWGDDDRFVRHSRVWRTFGLHMKTPVVLIRLTSQLGWFPVYSRTLRRKFGSYVDDLALLKVTQRPASPNTSQTPPAHRWTRKLTQRIRRRRRSPPWRLGDDPRRPGETPDDSIQ